LHLVCMISVQNSRFCYKKLIANKSNITTSYEKNATKFNYVYTKSEIRLLPICT
jgi:hypothetical protein